MLLIQFARLDLKTSAADFRFGFCSLLMPQTVGIVCVPQD